MTRSIGPSPQTSNSTQDSGTTFAPKGPVNRLAAGDSVPGRTVVMDEPLGGTAAMSSLSKWMPTKRMDSKLNPASYDAYRDRTWKAAEQLGIKVASGLMTALPKPIPQPAAPAAPPVAAPAAAPAAPPPPPATAFSKSRDAVLEGQKNMGMAGKAVDWMTSAGPYRDAKPGMLGSLARSALGLGDWQAPQPGELPQVSFGQMLSGKSPTVPTPSGDYVDNTHSASPAKSLPAAALSSAQQFPRVIPAALGALPFGIGEGLGALRGPKGEYMHPAQNFSDTTGEFSAKSKTMGIGRDLISPLTSLFGVDNPELSAEHGGGLQENINRDMNRATDAATSNPDVPASARIGMQAAAALPKQYGNIQNTLTTAGAGKALGLPGMLAKYPRAASAVGTAAWAPLATGAIGAVAPFLPKGLAEPVGKAVDMARNVTGPIDFATDAVLPGKQVAKQLLGQVGAGVGGPAAAQAADEVPTRSLLGNSTSAKADEALKAYQQKPSTPAAAAAADAATSKADAMAVQQHNIKRLAEQHFPGQNMTAVELTEAVKTLPPEVQKQFFAEADTAAKAAVSNADPKAVSDLAKRTQQGQTTPEEVNKGVSSLAQSTGADPNQPGMLEKLQSQFTSMDPGSQLGLMIGVPLAAIGLISSLTGGGFMSWLMTALGVGGSLAATGMLGQDAQQLLGGGLGQLANAVGFSGLGKSKTEQAAGPQQPQGGLGAAASKLLGKVPGAAGAAAWGLNAAASQKAVPDSAIRYALSNAPPEQLAKLDQAVRARRSLGFLAKGPIASGMNSAGITSPEAQARILDIRESMLR